MCEKRKFLNNVKEKKIIKENFRKTLDHFPKLLGYKEDYKRTINSPYDS